MRARVACGWIGWLVVGCAGGEIDGFSFGESSVPTTMPADVEDEESSSSDAEGAGTGESADNTGDGGDTTTGPSAGDDETSTGAPNPIDPVPSSSSSDDGGGGGADGQPDAGMYAPCLQPAECVGVTLCIAIVDAMQVPIDGFCTMPACVDPVADCDASPGGTALPSCLPVTIGGLPDAACALDCGGGRTCPTGMQCYAIAPGSICA